MADFCTKCAKEMFGHDSPPDINVHTEFESLKENECVSGFLCEGCGLRAIANIDGKLMVLRMLESYDVSTAPDDAIPDWELY